MLHNWSNCHGRDHYLCIICHVVVYHSMSITTIINANCSSLCNIRATCNHPNWYTLRNELDILWLWWYNDNNSYSIEPINDSNNKNKTTTKKGTGGDVFIFFFVGESFTLTPESTSMRNVCITTIWLGIIYVCPIWLRYPFHTYHSVSRLGLFLKL